MITRTSVHNASDSRPLPATVATWLDTLGDRYRSDELAVIEKSCHYALQAHEGQTRISGEPYVIHSLAVAEILADMRMDSETVAAAILHDVIEDTDITLESLRALFGERIAALVNGVTKMSLIQSYQENLEGEGGHREQLHAENLRKMLLAMAEDVRVVLIKLADRTHNMRTLAALPEHKQQRIARETLEIYAPLANRLGIWQIKWELEDLSFRYLEPGIYKKIAKMLDERRVDREGYIKALTARLEAELDRAGVHAAVSGRPKHIYSIWRKMKRKGIDYSQLHDVRGVRVLVDTVQDCYNVLGIVHSLWQYIPGEFDDYIATPKANNYRSIHTAIIGPEGKVVEVQIRTHDMHRHNELGVAAHWRYKEGSAENELFDRKINWLRQLIEWKNEVSDAGEFVDQFKADLFKDRIYVFTPRGNIVDLPQGATPLDFAYHIHTEVGHRCRGAKVNGAMVPLTYTLKTGQQVEILTVKQGGPSRDWLNPHLGYLKTSRARAKAQHWFRQQDYDKNVAEGRAIFEKELKRIAVTNINLEKLAEQLHFRSIDDFFVAIANGEIKSPRYLKLIQALTAPPPADDAIAVKQDTGRHGRRRSTSSGIRIQGVGNLMTHIANCCKPISGDEIVGYITQGRGVSIHRSDCPNINRYRRANPERIVPVEWGSDSGEALQVDIQVLAFDRQGLLRDIASILANEKINLLAVNTLSDSREFSARMRFTLEISDLETLSRVLTKIEQLHNVTEVSRITN